MAQFDVFRNPGRKRDLIPYVVSLQNARFERAGTRLVAALVSRGAVRVEAHYLAPWFTVAGQDVVLDIFNLATLPVARLSVAVASLADGESREKLVRALDEFLGHA